MLNKRRLPTIDQRVAVGIVYVAAVFTNAIDITIVNVALPAIGTTFKVSPGSVDVVVIAYLVSLAVFIPASGWIGDRFGGKRTLLTALLVFTAASALCGAAGSLSQLVVFRILQGAGGGMLIPVGMAMMYRIFPAAERVRLASLIMIPTAFAPALGPVLGGLLVTDASWRWVFYVNLPIGLVTCVFGMLFVSDQREPRPGRFDVIGFCMSGVGLGLAMYGVSEGPQRGWSSPAIWGSLLVGVALLVTMVFFELRLDEPMVDLRLLKDRMFRASNQMVLVGFTAFLGILYIVPLYYQDGRGLSALQSGLSTFPEAIGVLVGSQVVSRVLYPTFGPRRVIAAGLCGVALCTSLMSLTGAHTSLWWMRLLMFGLGYSMTHLIVSMQACAFATISPAATGRASMLFNVNRQLGGAAGVALLSTVLSAVGPVRHVAGRTVPHLTAYHAAFLTAGVAAVAGAILALVTIRDEDAASTRPGRRTLESDQESLGVAALE